jgi:DNA-binding HxlR family transcriptional regulator
MRSCPIEASLGTLGRKWTLTIIRDIAYFPDASFSLILKNNPGLLQRTLSLRLKQLAAANLIVNSAVANGARHPKYRLTTKGQEVWPILATLVQFGIQNSADRVFADGRPRDLEEVFPKGMDVLLGRFATSPPRPTSAPPT